MAGAGLGLPKTPKDLIGHPALVYRTGQGTKFWNFRDANGRLVKVHLTTRFVANNGAYLIEAAKAGLGVALEPEFVCGEALHNGDLVPALEDFLSYKRSVTIVRPANRPPSLRVQIFLEALRAELSPQT